jgi:hypothetical protein
MQLDRLRPCKTCADLTNNRGQVVRHMEWQQYAWCILGGATAPALAPALPPATVIPEAPVPAPVKHRASAPARPEAPAADPSVKGKKKSKTGMIAGISGAVISAILLVLLAVLIMRQNRKTDFSAALQPPHAAHAICGFNSGGFFAGSNSSGAPPGRHCAPSLAQAYSWENPVAQMPTRESLGVYAHARANKVHCSFYFL